MTTAVELIVDTGTSLGKPPAPAGLGTEGHTLVIPCWPSVTGRAGSCRSRVHAAGLRPSESALAQRRVGASTMKGWVTSRQRCRRASACGVLGGVPSLGVPGRAGSASGTQCWRSASPAVEATFRNRHDRGGAATPSRSRERHGECGRGWLRHILKPQMVLAFCGEAAADAAFATTRTRGGHREEPGHQRLPPRRRSRRGGTRPRTPELGRDARASGPRHTAVGMPRRRRQPA